jgi:hypothetical protein
MRVYGMRSMLNLPGFESTAAVVAEVAEKSWGWECSIQISDCDRKVSLSFCDPGHSETTEEQYENDLYKVDTLIGALQEFRSGMKRRRRSWRA